MSIGSVLLQPQRLERALGFSGRVSLGDDFVSVASRVALDPVGAEPIFTAFEDAFAGMSARLFANAGSGFDHAIARLRALAQPLLDRCSVFAASPPDIEDAEGFVELALELVDGAVALAEVLSAAKLRELIAEVQDILVSELKLGPEFLEAQLWQVVDEIVATLEALPLAGDADATRHSMIALLRRVRRALEGVLVVPALSVDQLAANLLDALRRAGLGLFIDKARCIAAAMRALRTAGTSLTTLTAQAGAGSVGAAQAKAPASGDQYCYYATWLASTEGRPTISFDSAHAFRRGLGWTLLQVLPAFPDDEIWVTADGSQVIRRNVFRDDEVLHEGSGVAWQDVCKVSAGEDAGYYTFKHLSPEFMEAWAAWSAVAVDFLKGLAHMIEVPTEPEDVASNLSHMFWNLINGSVKMSGQPPLIALVNARVGGPQALRWAWDSFPIVFTLLAALENRQTKADVRKFLYYLTLLGEDTLEAIKYDSLTNGVRDLFLSLFTLINYDGASYAPDGPDRRPLNRKHIDIWISLASLLTSKLLTLMIPRDNYNYPFAKDNDAMYAWWFAGATIAGAVGGFLGAGIGAFGLAQASDGALLGKSTGKAAFKGMLMFWPTLYSFVEGDTAGGSYNPSGKDYAGYPDHETSPYRLPYAGGTHQYCGQGNQGMWSHHASSDQVYAYDFGLDQEVMVVAARDGTVVDYFDWVANDIDPDDEQKREAMKRTLTDPYVLIKGQTGFLDGGDPADPNNLPPGNRSEAKIDDNNSRSVAANFVLIRHDNPFGTETDEQRAAHDRGADGKQVITYAAYLHGRLNGVRDVLTARTAGNDPTQIIGTTIRRGQGIMLAGHTGNSAHNHVHFEVMTDNSTTAPTDPVARIKPVRKGSMQGCDLPLVFGEVTYINPFSTDGVPTALNHYTSDNFEAGGP